MQMRQVANHPLLYRRNYTDEKLKEMAEILCRKERQYKTKKPQHVAEDLSFETDIALHCLCKKFASIKGYALSRKLALDSGKVRQLEVMLSKIFEKVN